MASIKPAGSRKKGSGKGGPTNSGAVGCIILVASAIVLVMLVLYYSISRG